MKNNRRIINPFQTFENWYSEAREQEVAAISSACCLSTIGLDGYPNARFVSLKGVKQGGFIITGPQDSRKGLEMLKNPQAALTFWWASIEKQVRVQGDVQQTGEEVANRYFKDRARDAQILAWASKQGQPLNDPKNLKTRFEHFSNLYDGKEVPRPENWAALRIDPIRIEFLEFRPSRLHQRILFEKTEKGWKKQILQP
jgi:pyridoxamine 5'-phosphate oxidase